MSTPLISSDDVPAGSSGPASGSRSGVQISDLGPNGSLNGEKSREKRKTKHQQPKCPICLERFDVSIWSMHYDYEVARLGQLGSDVYQDPLDKKQVKGKRGAAVLASQQLTAHKKRSVSAYEDTLSRIQRRRQQREDRRQRSQTETPPPIGDEQSLQTCFICNQVLVGDSEAVNLHIDRCLSSVQSNHEEQQNVKQDPSWDEYEWAGQRRVRATAMMEGGYGGAGFATTTKDEDVEDDLDVEDVDDEEFGQSQYTERDIVVAHDENSDEEALALRELVSGGTVQEAAVDRPGETGSARQDEFEEVPSDAGWERHLSTMSSNLIPSVTDGQPALVVDALKSRIRQLEAATQMIPRCLICLEQYKKPLTSVVCWHVHCEQCWLQSLGTKKLCPQCQKITTPADLRRVYL